MKLAGGEGMEKLAEAIIVLTILFLFFCFLIWAEEKWLKKEQK